MKKLISIILLSSITACKSAPKVEAAAPPPPAAPASVEEAVASPYRSPENRPRDVYRHPVETLNFFGVKPTMTVVEISPGTGWYMEILAPLLNANGQYIAALPPSNNGGEMAKLNDKIAKWIQGHPELAAKIKTVPLAPPADLVPAGTADMVVTFRNVHNWMSAGTAKDAFKAFNRALKPGGILGVVEHRLSAKAKQDPKAKSGYVSEREVKKLAKQAGFKFVGSSEINANPKDTKNFADGVWTLPPSYKLGDKDRAKYQEIGESDRMTLRFVKVK